MSETVTSSSPRVCILISNFYPIVGGGEKHAHLLARELARQNTGVIVVTRRRHANLAAFEEIDGFAVHRVGPNGFARLGKYFMILPSVCRLWKLRNEYDVVYVCGLRVLGFAGLFARCLTGKPCVLRAEARGELNGEFIWKSPEGSISSFRKLLFAPLIALRNVLFKRADSFLSISTPISEEFKGAGVSPEKLNLIPNGIDLEEFQPAGDKVQLRQSLGLPAGGGPEGTLFAYSGKLNRGKGLELLLRVWKRFAETQPDAHLVLIGSGGGQYLSCENELRDYVKEHDLGKRVTFAGYVDSVSDYLNAVDAFVFPSESESMGLVVLEALACRLPVIASRIPGVMDIMEDGVNGRLVDAKNEEAWLTALNAFVSSNEENVRMSDHGLVDVKERFSISAVTEQHITYFQKLS